jgi:parallel beta-helix repeat protein
MRNSKLLLPIILGLLLPSILLVAPSFAANTTGLTAAITATKGQVITGTINATGFDIGVYVGPGVTEVIIKNAKIFGANAHGIFIQDTRNVIVKDSEIYGNGNPTAGVASGKAIVLSGTHDCLIVNNRVHDNWGGGIEVTDDGPISPAALNPGNALPGRENAIWGNVVIDNLAACGIVVSSWNPGEGVSENLVVGNTVSITRSDGPYLGGIVVAADILNTTVKHTVVSMNTVTGGFLPGIIVHSNAPGDVVTGTMISFNTLSSNGAFPPSDPNDAQKPAGINIVAETPTSVLTNTLVIWNTVNNNYYGDWHYQDTNTKIIHLQGNAIVPIAP